MTKKNEEFLTVTVSGQMLGIPVLQVHAILRGQKVTHVPLAQKEVTGSLNLRGRIVTLINLRLKLNMPELPSRAEPMFVVVEHKDDLYSLIVDSVGEVMSLADEYFEETPATLEPSWQALTLGVYRLKENLLVILNVPVMLETLFKKEVDATA